MSSIRYVGPHERLEDRDQVAKDFDAFEEIVGEDATLTAEDRDYFNKEMAERVQLAMSYQASKDLEEMDLAHLSECEACQMDQEGADHEPGTS